MEVWRVNNANIYLISSREYSTTLFYMKMDNFTIVFNSTNSNCCSDIQQKQQKYSTQSKNKYSQDSSHLTNIKQAHSFSTFYNLEKIINFKVSKSCNNINYNQRYSNEQQKSFQKQLIQQEHQQNTMAIKQNYKKCQKQIDVMLDSKQQNTMEKQTNQNKNNNKISKLNNSYSRLNALYQQIGQLDVNVQKYGDLQQDIKQSTTLIQINYNQLLDQQQHLTDINLNLNNQLLLCQQKLAQLKSNNNQHEQLNDFYQQQLQVRQKNSDQSDIQNNMYLLELLLEQHYEELLLSLKNIPQILSEKQKHKLNTQFNTQYDEFGINSDYYQNLMKEELNQICLLIDETNQNQAVHDLSQIQMDQLVQQEEQLTITTKNLQKQNYNIVKINKEIQGKLDMSNQNLKKYQLLQKEKQNNLILLKEQFQLLNSSQQ